MTTPVPLVLAKLQASLPAVDLRTGTLLPTLVQTLNNQSSNILVAFNALAAGEAANGDLIQQVSDLVEEIVTLNHLVTTQAAMNALASSYTSPSSILSSSTTGGMGTITIASHTRIYGDGSSKSVTGGTLTGMPVGDSYYVYYNDPDMAGGAVIYHYTTDDIAPVQTGGVHCCGGVYVSTGDTGSTPNTGSANHGSGVQNRPNHASIE